MSVSNTFDWVFHKGRPVLTVDQIVSLAQILNWIKKREEPKQTFNVFCLLVVDPVWFRLLLRWLLCYENMKAYSPEQWLEINPISPDMLLSGYFFIAIGKGKTAGIKIKTPKCEPLIWRIIRVYSYCNSPNHSEMNQNRVQWAMNTTQLICSHIDMINKPKCWSILKTLWILFLKTNSFKWYY